MLSAIKSALAVLESANGGISLIIDVNVHLGKAVSSVKDLVDEAWHASLYGISALFGISLLLKLSSFALEPLVGGVIAVAGLGLLLGLFSEKAGRLMKEGVYLGVLLGVLLHLVLPLSVFSASLVSQSITSSLGKEVYGDLVEKHSDISAIAGTEKDHSTSLKHQVSGTIDFYEKSNSSFANRIEQLISTLGKHIALVAFNVFIFPLGFLFLGLYASRRLLKTALKVG